MTMLDVEPVVLENLNLTPRCAGIKAGIDCPDPAHWVAVFACGSQEPICDYHRAWILDVAVGLYGGEFRCTTHCVPPRDTVFVEVVPL